MGIQPSKTVRYKTVEIDIGVRARRRMRIGMRGNGVGLCSTIVENARFEHQSSTSPVDGWRLRSSPAADEPRGGTR